MDKLFNQKYLKRFFVGKEYLGSNEEVEKMKKQMAKSSIYVKKMGNRFVWKPHFIYQTHLNKKR